MRGEMSEGIVRSLYGHPSGAWFLLERPDGVFGPPRINECIHLGPPGNLFTALNYHMTQQDLADLLGLTQQAVSRYISDTAWPPRLTADQWTLLVKTYFQHCLDRHQ